MIQIIFWLFAVTQQSYDLTAEQYANNVKELFPAGMQEFMDLLPAQGKILDLGCGSGRDAKLFSENEFQVVGIDFSTKLLEIAKKNAPDAQFYQMDIGHLSFPDHTFDGVWASASLLHCPKIDLSSELATIRRILKPDGVFYLSVKKGIGEGIEKDTRYGGVEKYWSYFDEEEIGTFLKNAGFTITHLSITGIENAYQAHPWIHVRCFNQDPGNDGQISQ